MVKEFSIFLTNIRHMKFSQVPVNSLFEWLNGDTRLFKKTSNNTFDEIPKVVTGLNQYWVHESRMHLDTRKRVPSPEQIQMALDILGLSQEDLDKIRPQEGVITKQFRQLNDKEIIQECDWEVIDTWQIVPSIIVGNKVGVWNNMVTKFYREIK